MKKHLICILMVLMGWTTMAQENAPSGSATMDNADCQLDNHKLTYGIYLGMSQNWTEVYCIQNGVTSPMDNENSSLFMTGFRMAVSGEVKLGNNFSLRCSPGISLMGHDWMANNPSIPISPLVQYRIESVLAELPLDVKCSLINHGKVHPFLTSGVSYGLDFTTLSNEGVSLAYLGDEVNVMRQSATLLRYNFGVGVDFDTRYLKIGVELNAGCNIMKQDYASNSIYFKNPAYFSLGVRLMNY